MTQGIENSTVEGIGIEDVVRHLDSGREAIMNILQRGKLGSDDIQHLRRDVFAMGAVSQSDAEGLFAIERSGLGHTSEWADFFVEAITDFTVWQMRPTGVVSETQGEWLLEQIDQTKSMTSLAALFNILAEADRVPAWLPAAARGRVAAGWNGVAEALEAAREEEQLAA